MMGKVYNLDTGLPRDTPLHIETRIKDYNLCEQVGKTSIKTAMLTLIDQTPEQDRESMREALSWVDINNYCDRPKPPIQSYPTDQWLMYGAAAWLFGRVIKK